MKDIKDMNLAELANALQRYEFDMLNDQVANRLRVIHEETRWIPVFERMPEAGEWVLAWMSNGAFEVVHESYLDQDSDISHWQRITPPEAP